MRAFISYSHQDVGALERLHVHLANLQREGRIETWYDREILAGDVLEGEISRELEATDLFLLMVSPDFIASNYCVEREMQRALERHDAGEARVVPIIVEPCDWAAMPQLRRLKAVPKDGEPISEWANANNAYLNVVQEIRRIVDAGDSVAPEPAYDDPAPAAPQQDVPRYRVQQDFDEIDRSEYRDAAFAMIKDYFRRAIGEIDAVDGLRGRFVDRGANSFGSTVVNRGRQQGTAHITVHCRNAGFALGDIYYSFNENAGDNTANGAFNVSSDEYEQFLVVTMAMFGNGPERLNPEQAAEYLWNKFIEQAGIVHA
ncbi:MAG: toll/interleukin-1 receptor domain-containing protein [Antarcticimicrobium sp.]|uniref:toll/interleukin-1 receptor domain-containing protein n=1 Tax=Antarcticimicrobium sp. TaxID=2824147 RepID=UPI0026185107|nr:toll/interleukin-1 receptor domain-containing protein [Antarcticimicrobium sp.]MDF1716087.1 toll/interleukin-1 receptor domain-containing protein [Antarcticimicrobium sp.]